MVTYVAGHGFVEKSCSDISWRNLPLTVVWKVTTRLCEEQALGVARRGVGSRRWERLRPESGRQLRAGNHGITPMCKSLVGLKEQVFNLNINSQRQ